MRLIFPWLLCGVTCGCVDVHDAKSVVDREYGMRTTLLKSPAVARYVASIHSPWTYLIDERDAKSVTVAVGEDLPDHFVRGLTAKVTDDGRVYVLRTLPNGNEEWRME